MPPSSFNIPTSSDPYERLFISLNPDCSLTRLAPVPISPPSQDPSSPSPSLSKDLPLNPTLNTSLRLYIPKTPSSHKLPIILYIHGGGFILLSNSNSFINDACSQRAAKIPALIVSLEYRLAPEHRLPAAYEDAVDALLWIHDQAVHPETADPWVRDYADFSRSFLMGCSAGANIAYHLGLRSLDLKLEHVKVSGLILNEPYFSGVEKTESEARSEEAVVLSLASNYLMWELSLPIGADRDHEFSNPATSIGKAKRLPKCLVKGFVGDPLYDREKIFVEMLMREGVEVVALMEDEGYHGIEVVDASKAEDLLEDCRKFIYGADDD